jgi:hypothetical protein
LGVALKGTVMTEMIDQARFTRILRRLVNFDRDDFAEVVKSFKSVNEIPPGDWNMCQMDPVRYYLANGRLIQDRMFEVLKRSESVQVLGDS